MVNLDQAQVMTFDCYGTLIDWESGILTALKPLLQTHGIAMADDKLLALYAESEPTHQTRAPFRCYSEVLELVMDDIGQALGFTPTPEERRIIVDSLPHWKPFADTVPALRILARHYQLGIISNIDDALIRQTVRHFEDVPFQWIVTAEQVHSYKPSINNFLQAMDIIGQPKEHWIHVAQSLYHDVAPAREVGLASIWINRRHDQEGFGATKAACIMPDLEFPDLKSLAERVMHTATGQPK